MAAEEKECTLVGGIHVAGAVAKAQYLIKHTHNSPETHRNAKGDTNKGPCQPAPE